MSDLKKRVADFIAYPNGYYFAPVSAALVRDLAAEVERYESLHLNDEHIAWVRYQMHDERPTTIHLCDSDDKGAFRVYRNPKPSAELTAERDALKAENERLKIRCESAEEEINAAIGRYDSLNLHARDVRKERDALAERLREAENKLSQALIYAIDTADAYFRKEKP